MSVNELLAVLAGARARGQISGDWPVVVGESVRQQTEPEGVVWGVNIAKDDVVWLTPTPQLGLNPTALR